MEVKPVISVCLCCWNDLGYLKILFNSILRHAVVPFEICVYDNGSIDGTPQWLRKMAKQLPRIKYKLGDKNLGCTSANKAVKMATGNYILHVNSDMYMLPEYDIGLINAMKQYNDAALICPYLIEPSGIYGKASRSIVYNAGNDHQSFNEDVLLAFFKQTKNNQYVDIYDYTHPVFCTKEVWGRIGGLDEDYFPGWAMDCQFTYDAFCLGIKPVKTGKAFVYHFVNKTLKGDCFSEDESVRMCNNGLDMFEKKTGLTHGSLGQIIKQGELV